MTNIGVGAPFSDESCIALQILRDVRIRDAYYVANTLFCRWRTPIIPAIGIVVIFYSQFATLVRRLGHRCVISLYQLYPSSYILQRRRGCASRYMSFYYGRCDSFSRFQDRRTKDIAHSLLNENHRFLKPIGANGDI